jgi:hypothetical protein
MRKNNAVTVLLAATLVVIAVLGTVGLATQTNWGPLGFIDADAGEDTETPDQGQAEMLSWEDHELALEVVSPVATDFSSTAFIAEPNEDGEYGNYVDYNESDAQSSLSAGVDYYHEEVDDSRTITYPANLGLPSGETLDFAIVDTTGSEYHDTFTSGEVPTEVATIDYENDNTLSVVNSGAFHRMPSYSSDSAEITQINGDSTEFSDFGSSSTDLVEIAYDSDTGQTVEATRTIEFDHGSMALGEVDVANVSSKVSEATITVTYENSDGETVSLFDEQVADEDGITDFDEELTENMDTEPEWVNSELEVTYDIEFDGSALHFNQELFSAGILNIYGNYVGQNDLVDITA